MKNVIIIEDNIRIAQLIKANINSSEKYYCKKIYKGPPLFLASNETPDFILLDIIMPNMNGIKAIPFILKKTPEVKIIMYTIKDDSETIFEALKEGAVGYIDKNSFKQSFEDVFSDVENGGGYMTPTIARKVIEFFNKKKNNGYETLTKREKEIVMGILDGLSYKLVADKYEISIDTVRMNIRHIYKKLNINSKGELFKMMQE